jgi:hypothetical protein
MSNSLIASIEPLLKVSLAQSERQGLDTVTISTARARMILSDIAAAKKGKAKPPKEPGFFKRLDRIHGLA